MDQEQAESLVEFTGKIRSKKCCLASLERFLVGSSIKPQMWLAGYHKIYKLWALVVGIGGLFYTYIIMKK